MVLGALVYCAGFAVQQLEEAAIETRAREFINTCLKNFAGEQLELNLELLKIENEDDFYFGGRSVRFRSARVDVDKLSGYIPFASFSWPDEPRRVLVAEPTRPVLTQRIQQICNSAKYGSRITVTSTYRSWQHLEVHFAPIHDGIRYANWYGGVIKFNLPNGAVSDVSLGWYPERPATMPPIRITVDQVRWLATQKLAAQGDFRPRFESMPTELVFTAELGNMPPGFMNKPAYPRPINKPAVRTDVIGVARYHVIFKTEGDRNQTDHFMFDPTDGRMTWSDRPRSGGGALPVAMTPQPWIPPAKGTLRIASKSDKASIDLGKSIKRTVSKGTIVPNCLVISGNRVLSGQWSAKDRMLKVASAGTVHSVKY